MPGRDRCGITSRIPPDQVINAMKEVGESMHISLKETGEGGVANTPEARKIKDSLVSSEQV